MILSPLAQGFGVCKKEGVILIPEVSGAIPSYSTQVKNADGALYGHFVPVPKTYLTRRGDIILFTENACDILYLEKMYTKKIRELYEQQIKTVDDLNKSILFYGSKTPGEYSLNFIRGKFYRDRDVAVQPGHLPNHYLNSLTRHVKLSSVLRPRAPPGTSYLVDTHVKTFTIPVTQHMDVEEEEERYEEKVVIKERPERLPPIQVSTKLRPIAGSTSPRLNKVGMDEKVLGLSGTNALQAKGRGSEVPTLPKVVTGPSAKARSKSDWKKLSSIMNAVHAIRRLSGEEGAKEPKGPLKIIDQVHQDSRPVYRSAMEMDIQFLKENRRHINGSHAGVYLTQILRDGAWKNEDIPVFVTPDGKVFISSVIVNQPQCSSDRIKFTNQDDADHDVHRKPEEGSLTFSDGHLTGWVKFPEQRAVKIRGKRWDPRQTGNYVVERKVGEETWEVVPLDLSIMLGGKVTMGEEPVQDPQFEENKMRLVVSKDDVEEAGQLLMATFDKQCTSFTGILTSDPDVELASYSKTKLDDLYKEVEIRGKKWNPAIAGHYYSLKKTSLGSWVPHDLPITVNQDGSFCVLEDSLGVPDYNGNDVDVLDISRKGLPDSLSLSFLEGKYVGEVVWEKGSLPQEIRGIRWDSSMIGKYSTQEKEDGAWVNKDEMIVIEHDGSIFYGGVSLEQGFIVDNKVFAVDEGGVESFFNNSGPVSDASLAGQSFLMQRDSPIRALFHSVPPRSRPAITRSGDGDGDVTTTPDDVRKIQEAEIVFSSNRLYGHANTSEGAGFKEIRGYKWDEAIIGEYFTEVQRSDGDWGKGPIISINPDGSVTVNGHTMSDTLLKDNIASISGIIDVPDCRNIDACLIAVQDKMLSGWIQTGPDGSPKIQIRGSLWKDGPGAQGSYICVEKIAGTWTSSSKSVIVTPSNKVILGELQLEGDLDGLSARLKRQVTSRPSSGDSTCTAKLRFDCDTFTGTVTDKDNTAEFAGFKYETVPGVYLLESRPLHSDGHWTGLNLQLVVSDSGRLSMVHKAVTDMTVEDAVLRFESDSVLPSLALRFKDKAVQGSGIQQDKDKEAVQVEIRGKTWLPKIAGTYETEIFSDSHGWKAAKKLEITPQGDVLYGNALATNVKLDTDTMSFGDVQGLLKLKDVTLAFDNDTCSGNVVMPNDSKTRVMRGKRIGGRPASGISGCDLSLGSEEDDNFQDLNGQIGSTLKAGSSPDPESPVDQGGLPGITSDYGSASDVITHHLSGSRTDALSSLEEGVSDKSYSGDVASGEDEGAHSGEPYSSLGKSKASNDPASDVDIADISLDMGPGEADEAGVSFETWPPESDTDVNLEPEPESETVTLDILPKGLSSHGKTESKDSIVVPEVIEPEPEPEPPAPAEQPAQQENDAKQTKKSKVKTEKAPSFEPKTKAETPEPIQSESRSSPESKTPKLPPVPTSPATSTKSSKVPDKATRTPLPSIPSLDKPGLTKPVKIPGLEMKNKGAAAEITEDAGVLNNYLDPKKTEKKKKGATKKVKKGKKTDKKDEKKSSVSKPTKPTKLPARLDVEDLDRRDSTSEPELKSPEDSSTDLEDRVQKDIDQARDRRTPTARTPIPLSRINRDSSRDPSPSSSGFNTPVGYYTESPTFPQKEFQGALMAAKKIRETTDQQLDGKIPSDIREHPVAEEVAEKFGVEMKVRDDNENKLTLKERRELARQKKKEDADKKRKDRDEEKRRLKEEEERRLAEKEGMERRRAEREQELAVERQRELARRREEEAKKKKAKLEEKERKKRDEERMVDAKKKLEEELRRRREAETARLAENERQKQLELDREKEEQQKRMVEAEAIRAQMEEEIAREMLEYERKVREEEERRKIEDALKAEAERRLLDEEERKRIIALARHLWNKGVRVEGENLTEELQISSIFYSYFNYLQSEEPFNPDIDITYKIKLDAIEKSKPTG